MFNDWHLAIRVDLWDKPVWLHLQMDVNLLCGDVLGSCNQTYALEGYGENNSHDEIVTTVWLKEITPGITKL